LPKEVPYLGSWRSEGVVLVIGRLAWLKKKKKGRKRNVGTLFSCKNLMIMVGWCLLLSNYIILDHKNPSLLFIKQNIIFIINTLNMAFTKSGPLTKNNSTQQCKSCMQDIIPKTSMQIIYIYKINTLIFYVWVEKVSCSKIYFGIFVWNIILLKLF
jgi:hypothetical protein